MGFCQGKKKIAVLLAVIIGMASSVFAAGYTDVSQSHWAYSAIMELAQKGIMVGDNAGAYHPESQYNKFDTAKVLAKLTGFKYIDATAAEQTYMTEAYEEYKNTIQLYKKAFSMWDATADREIAYLMKKGILTQADLDKFVVRMENGAEKQTFVTREECCNYLVKLIGGAEMTDSVATAARFQDDNTITDTYKNDVYFLKALGIVAGDAEGYFRPKDPITKAAMASMIQKVLSISNTNTQNANQNTTTGAETGEPNSNQGNTAMVAGSISGTIDKVYTSLNTVQIKGANGKVSTYRLGAGSRIYIDGKAVGINDLTGGLAVTAVQTNAVITLLNAKTNGNTANQTNTGSNKEDTTNPGDNGKITQNKVAGTILSITQLAGGTNVTIKIPQIDAKGIVSYQEETYIIGVGCSIKREGISVDVSDLQLGEVIYAEVEDSRITAVTLEKKETIINDGRLVSKKYNSGQNQIVLSIADMSGLVSDFIVTDESVLRRDDIGNCKWSSLKVGDTITLSASGHKIKALYAVGALSTVTCWLDEVVISNDVSSIVVREDESTASKKREYIVTDNTIDLTTLQLNSKIKVKLDSSEVYDIIVIEKGSNQSGAQTGYLYTIMPAYLDIIDKLESDDYERIFMDEKTKFTDAVKGKSITFEDLNFESQVYIIYRMAGTKKFAKTVTVIDW